MTTHLAPSATIAISATVAALIASAPSAQAQVDCSDPPAVPEHHHLAANADTVHWGYFSKTSHPR